MLPSSCYYEFNTKVTKLKATRQYDLLDFRWLWRWLRSSMQFPQKYLVCKKFKIPLKLIFFFLELTKSIRLSWLSIFHAISIEIWRFIFLAYHKKSGPGLAVSHSDSSSYQREKETWEWRWEWLLISKLKATLVYISS